MNFIKKNLKYIESLRGSKKLSDFLLVTIKDIIWVIIYFIPHYINKTFQRIIHHMIFLIFNCFDKYHNKVNTYYKISFCITCMNRTGHLKKTLRKNIKYNLQYPNLEFVLLDYNSADGLKDWVLKNFKKELDSGLLAYYRTEKPKHFHMANAKNIAHYLASGDIVCNLDADNFTGKDFAFYINLIMQKSLNIIGVHIYNLRSIKYHISDCGGRVFISKANFVKLGGYNENFIGWGFEDDEFKQRAIILGLAVKNIPRYFLSVINHNNNLRVKNMEVSIKDSSKKNRKLLEESKLNNNYYIKNKPIDFSEIKRIR
jgi:hypothetical protein